MSNTPRMKWPIPGENVDPWFDAFVDMMAEVDASGYAAREDRNILGTGGGNFTWTVGTSLVTWAGQLNFVAPITGFLWQITAGNATLAEGQMLYIVLPRAPTSNVTLAPAVANNISLVDGDSAFVICIRRNNKLYFRNGRVMADGDSFEVFEANGAGGGGGSGTTALIFQPGSAFTGPAIFNSWTDIMTKLAALRVGSNGGGQYTIEMDDSLGTVTIPAGTHDMTDVDWIGLGRATLVSVNVADGALLPGLRKISQGMTVLFGGATSPVQDMADGDQFTCEDASIQMQGGATASFFDLSTIAGPVTFRLINGAFIDSGGGEVVTGIPMGQLAIVDVVDNGSFGSGIFAGAGGLYIEWSESSSFSETQSVGSVTLITRAPERYPIVTSAINFTATAGTEHHVDTSGGNRIVTLPATYDNRGSLVIIKHAGTANTVTINPGGTDTIDGAASYVISTPKGSVTLVSDGGNPGDWKVITEKKNIIGVPGEKIRRTVAMAIDAETDQNTFQVVGDFALNPTDYALTGTTREIRFLVVGLITNSATTGEIQLYNLTDSSVVSTQSFNGAGDTSPTKKISAALVLPASEKMYEIRIRVTGGTPPTDKVFAMWAGFQIDNIY